ncbi:helix-turn-helix transcriptional regulator [Microbacterium sp. CJ88]|uniref:helix-turn-helix transcriptional regulator n=1 Tax=Microbacterium sp. CJ88 TaxID=3445672 RepID=UPI003F655FFC
MEKMLTPEEVADLLGLSVVYLAQLRWQGGGPKYSKLGRAVRYLPSDVQAWIEANQHERTDRPVVANA